MVERWRTRLISNTNLRETALWNSYPLAYDESTAKEEQKKNFDKTKGLKIESWVKITFKPHKIRSTSAS